MRVIETRGGRAAAISLLAALALECPTDLHAAPAIQTVERHRIVIRVRPLNVKPVGEAEGQRGFEFALDEERTGRLAVALEWPDAGALASVALEATEEPPTPGQDHRLRLTAVVRWPGGAPSRATRSLAFDEGTTALFEVARRGSRALTLAIEAECTRALDYIARPRVGAPVGLALEIQRVVGERTVPLETNRLNTFVGERVSYSFRLGDTDESIRIDLTPLRLDGDLAHLEIEISGMLPDEERLLVLARKEQWVSSRGAASSLTVLAGDGASGFRFLVTPEF